MVELTPVDFLQGLGGIAALPHPYDDQQQVVSDQQRTQGNAQALQLGAAKLSAIAQQKQQAQQYQTDVASALKNPSPQNFAALYAKYPEQHDALKQAWDAQDAPTKQANLTQLGNVFSYLSNGKPELAAKSLQDRIDAEKAAGLDTSDDEQILGLMTSGKPEDLAAAKGIAGMHLAAVLGPDKYGETLKTLGLGPDVGSKKFTNTPQGDIYDTSTGEVAHAAGPKPEVDTIKVFDENGNVVGSRRVIHPPAGGVTGEQIEQLALNAVPGAVVTSGARTPQHNADVGGVPNSYHLTDQARDMVPPQGMSIGEFHNRLQTALPGVKVLNEGDHVHIQPIARNTQTPTGFATKPLGPVGSSSLLDDSTIQTMAQQYLAGDPSVMQNLGRGKQGAENIVRLRREITSQAKAQGMNGADIAAQMADFKGTLSAERAAGTRTANVELASTEAQRLFPLALQTSQAIPRNGFLPFSRAQQAIRGGNNNPKLRQFVAANMALVNVYSRAVSPTGQPTDSDKAHARELLDTAYDQPSYAATLQQMQKEILAARAAPREVRSDLRAQISGHATPSAAPPPDILAILKKYGHN